MSKRIANSRERKARNGRVRIGWKKVRMINDLEKMDKAIREGDVEEKMIAKFQDFKAHAKQQLKSFFPSRLFRHQSR